MEDTDSQLQFSIIIPSYNRIDLLKLTLASIWEQTYKDYEICVVDDGSSDGSWEYLTTLGDRVVAARQKNKGPGAARNRAVELAQGEYLVFLDSDDLLFPWSLETYAEAIRAGHKPGFLAGKPFPFSSNDELVNIQACTLKWEQHPDFLSAAESKRSNIVTTCSAVVMRRDIFLENHGFTERFINAEDTDLWLKSSTAEGFVQILKPCTFAFRQHAESAVSDLNKTYEGVLFIINKEYHGEYPGGSKRTAERLRIILRHSRSTSIALVRERLFAEGVHLYMKTFLWNVKHLRVRYIVGFCCIATVCVISNFLKKH